jgi:hypothetical protein
LVWEQLRFRVAGRTQRDGNRADAGRIGDARWANPTATRGGLIVVIVLDEPNGVGIVLEADRTA